MLTDEVKNEPMDIFKKVKDSILTKTGFSNPKEVFAKVYSKVADSLALGYKRVIVDSTAITKKDRKKIFDNLSNLNVDFVCVYFPVDINKSIKQNKMRARHVPEDVIYRMADKFQAPTIEEGFKAVFLVKE